MRRREGKTVKSVIKWKPLGKRPCGRSRKRWIDVVEEDLMKMGMNTWREMVHGRVRW